MSETTQSGLSENTVAAVSYITFVPAVVFLLLPPYNANSFIRFHCWQSIFFNVIAMVAWIAFRVALIPAMFSTPFGIAVMGRAMWLAWMLVWILCAISALNAKRFKLPVLGAFAEKQAGA
jgi:uncharacterized membrane protein